MAKLNQNWHNLNWKKLSKYVKNLQKELVVAYKNNDQQLLFSLQKKLMMSFEGRALAVRQTVINDGKNTILNAMCVNRLYMDQKMCTYTT